MIKLTYNIIFNKNLNINQTHAIKKIQSVLQDNRGWKRLGYDFIYTENKKKIDFTIIFASNKFIQKTCNFNGLSCADILKKTIYINIDRYRLGSKLSNLKLNDYRTYVINHEVGHILGRSHTQCNTNINEKVPVMMQQTLGIGKCKPNPWPLDWE